MFHNPRKRLFKLLAIVFTAGGIVVGGMATRFALRDDISNVSLSYQETQLLYFGDGVLAAILWGLLTFLVFSSIGLILAFAIQVIVDKTKRAS